MVGVTLACVSDWSRRWLPLLSQAVRVDHLVPANVLPNDNNRNTDLAVIAAGSTTMLIMCWQATIRSHLRECFELPHDRLQSTHVQLLVLCNSTGSSGL